MANLSLIMRRNIMISRCLDLFVQIPKHSTTGYYLFKNSVSTKSWMNETHVSTLYHIVKILLLSLFFIRLDGDGPPWPYYLDGHSQGLRSSRHLFPNISCFFLLPRRLKFLYSKCLVSINYNPTSFEQDSR
jgi:hypothetical protein